MFYRNTLSLILIFVTFHAVCAQQEQSDSKESSAKVKTKVSKQDIEAAKKSYVQLKKQVLANKWKQVKKLITKRASDQFCTEQVVTAMALVNSELPIQVPEMAELASKIREIVKTHELDKIEIDTSKVFRTEVTENDLVDQSSGKEDGEPETGILAHTAKVAKAIGDGERRWKIIDDLWGVQKQSPLAFSPMTGTIQKQESLDVDSIRLRVKLVPLKMLEQDPEAELNVIIPPVIVKMVKQDGKWLYNGVDRKATRKAADEFIKNESGILRTQPRDDF